MELIKKNNKETLIWKEYSKKDDAKIPYLTYPALDKTGLVNQCFSTRLGGVSEGIYTSMNLSFTRGDKDEAVRENFRRIAEIMNAEMKDFVFTDQTHTTNVRIVTGADAGNGLTKEKSFFDVDGLITNTPGLVLSTFYADCVPLYFLDPVKKAIGLSHSGWRGTVDQMGQKTVEAMTNECDTDPKNLLCAIGPSICQDCYEVGAEVATQFQKEFGIQSDEIMKDKKNGKYQLDLWRANEIVLERAGVKKENIFTTNICTCCNDKILFSHRASQGKRGNLGAFLSLKKEGNI